MFTVRWSTRADGEYRKLRARADRAKLGRKKKGKTKSSRQEGTLKQVAKALDLLRANPRHPGLQSHHFTSLQHPYDQNGKVFEVYVQQHAPAAYRLFWCYGPEQGQITIIAITPHP
jgi:hypothetical protein